MDEINAKWKYKILFNPEDDIIFNSSRLLILFDVVRDLDIKKGMDLERLSYYDFFAANPFLIIKKDNPERIDLEIEGFISNKIEYYSTAQLYRTKRASLKQYLSLLITKGLINMINKDGKFIFNITQLGIDTSKKLNTMYALAYRKSVAIIVNMLKRYSDKKLWESANVWLESKSFQIDLYDLVDEFNE